METTSLLPPTMENIRIELARRKITYSQLHAWAEAHGMRMAYNQMTAHIREERTATLDARRRIAAMINGYIEYYNHEPALFDEEPQDTV